MSDRFPWVDEYLTGHEAIDNDHRKLFEIANRLFLIENPHDEKDKVSENVKELYEYMRVHFEREESVMTEHSYSDIENHREKHEGIIHQMNETLRGSKNFEELESYLKKVMEDWLVNHIIHEDMKIKDIISAVSTG